MELTLADKDIIVLSTRSNIVNYLKLANNQDEYFENKAKENNDLYKKIMGCDFEPYADYIAKKNQSFYIVGG